MNNRIELHSQIKAFYSIVFNGDYDIRPTHISLYMFLLNQNNRNMWVTWFKCPYDLAMQGAGIQSKTTYYLILDDLVKFGLIEYEKGVNLHKAPKIKISILTIPKNDTVTVPLSDTLSGTLSGTLSDNIIRLITNNLNTINQNYQEFENFVLNLGKPNTKKESVNIEEDKQIFEEFRKLYKGTKRGLDIEFDNFRKKHSDWKEVNITLKDCLNKQIKAREINARNKKFVPQWKNLQTYINNRSWEEEIAIEQNLFNTTERYIMPR